MHGCVNEAYIVPLVQDCRQLVIGAWFCIINMPFKFFGIMLMRNASHVYAVGRCLGDI